MTAQLSQAAGTLLLVTLSSELMGFVLLLQTGCKESQAFKTKKVTLPDQLHRTILGLVTSAVNH